MALPSPQLTCRELRQLGGWPAERRLRFRLSSGKTLLLVSFTADCQRSAGPRPAELVTRGYRLEEARFWVLLAIPLNRDDRIGDWQLL